ncbi:MAG: NADP-dependent isocitrate dehydrogenase, partial [Gammaproteobacteria bacterium]|nr:NADP-dependent isocitrate dehydrogenase [Gammaproteobacteria bacterium]
LDNRGSHLHLATYWAEELAKQTDDPELQAYFAPISKKLNENKATILEEMSVIQGHPADIGGYYHPIPDMADAIMQPSDTLKRILASAGQ